MNDISRIRGLVLNAVPAVREPGTDIDDARWYPCLLSKLTEEETLRGVSSAGFTITVFPAEVRALSPTRGA